MRDRERHMAELHIDDDWKKQAQEEKRRLAEEEQKRSEEREQRQGVAAAASASASPAALDAVVPTPGGEASRPATSSARGRAAAGVAGTRERGAPEASVSALVNSLATQALLYLGVLAPRGAEPQIDLDLSKFNVDLLGVLEEKTRGNLTEEEQKLLDNVLYDVLTRYGAVASQYATE